MATLFDRQGLPLRVDEMIEREVKKAHKKRSKKLDKRASAVVDPIAETPRKVLLKMVRDPRTNEQRRQRCLDEIRRRGVTSI